MVTQSLKIHWFTRDIVIKKKKKNPNTLRSLPQLNTIKYIPLGVFLMHTDICITWVVNQFLMLFLGLIISLEKELVPLIEELRQVVEVA